MGAAGPCPSSWCQQCLLGTSPWGASQQLPCPAFHTGDMVWPERALGVICKAKKYLLGLEVPSCNQPCSLYCSLCWPLCTFSCYVNYRNYKEKLLHPFGMRFFFSFVIWSHSVRKPFRDSHSASFSSQGNCFIFVWILNHSLTMCRALGFPFRFIC